MLKLKTDGTVYILRNGLEVTLRDVGPDSSYYWRKYHLIDCNGRKLGSPVSEKGTYWNDGREDIYDIVAVKVNAHPHAESMLEYAKDAATTDKPWLLWETCYNSQWDELCSNPIWSVQCQYRRKPKQKPSIKIGDLTVPQPMKVKPELNQEYFVVMLGSTPVDCRWDNDSADNEFFNNGRCYETREEAEQVGKALVSLLTQ